MKLASRRHLALALLLVGALLRLWGLGSFPPGLNQDEASIGYDAWALLQSGMDRNGDRWPVLFASWGSGQNVLYAYLLLPFLRLFGLSVPLLRLPAALCGTFSLFLFWRLARRQGEDFGLWALLVLALNPWHLLLSRWALESNLLPSLQLLGLFLIDAALRGRKWLLLPAAAALGLALYAYGAAFLFLSFFLPLCCLLLRRRRFPLPVFLAALAVFLLIALPIALCQLRNVLGLESGKLLWMTLPRLTQTRQAATVSFSPNNFRALLRLLWTQSDGLPWNSVGPFGLFYDKPGLLLALFGLGCLLRRTVKRQLGSGDRLCLFALLASLLSALFIQINVNRINMLFLPLLWCQAAGFSALARRLRGLGPLLAALLLCCSLSLLYYCQTRQRAELEPAFHAGLCEAICWAEAQQPEQVYISASVNMPYIYALFCTQTPPEDFLATVSYADPSAAFRQVQRFGHFRFGPALPRSGLCILPLYQAQQADELHILQFFQGYAVAEYIGDVL